MKKSNKPLRQFKTLRSKIVYKNKWIRIQEDQTIRPDGRKGLYAYVMTHPAVFIIALTEQNEVYLVKQQRYIFGSMETLEIPAGNTDGQEPLKAAKRELQEETGLRARNWKYLGDTQPFNAISNEVNYFYLATNLTQTSKHKQAEDGISETVKAPFPKLVKMVKSGEVNDGQSIVAIMKAALDLGFLK